MNKAKKQTTSKEITRHTSTGGVRIYCIPIQTFPGHFTNIYLVLTGELVALIDLGSGWGESNAELVAGIDEVRSRFGEKVTLREVDLLLITHGHIDHFGSLAFFREQSDARVGIHALDARQVINLEETVMVVARDLQFFLETAGISEKTRNGLMEMYKGSRTFLKSMSLDFRLRERDEPVHGIFRIHHTPGHCPGQVCIEVDDVLFTGDHILSHISPHQSPEAISRYTGLGHYLASLEKIKGVKGLNLALGGHQEPMPDVYGRIEAIQAFHAGRLDDLLEICRKPRTIKEISGRLFAALSGYQILLALEETAAHVEHLYQRGRLAIDNLEDLEKEVNPVLRYRTR